MIESARTFRTTFTNADVRGGVYTVTHNLGSGKYVVIYVNLNFNYSLYQLIFP